MHGIVGKVNNNAPLVAKDSVALEMGPYSS